MLFKPGYFGAGSGGSVTVPTGTVNLVHGPIRLRSNSKAQEEGFVGDTLPLLLYMEDENGQRLALDGATLSYQLSQYGSVVTSSTDIDSGNIYTNVQMFRVDAVLPATQGVARLTVTRTVDTTDVQTAELLINVKPK